MLIFMYLDAGLLKQWVSTHLGSRNVILWSRNKLVCQNRYNNFFNFTRKLNAGLRGIYFYYIVRSKMLTNIDLIAYNLAQTHASV